MSKTADQSPLALGSTGLGKLKAHSSNSDRTGTERPFARDLNENTASSSDVNTNTSTVRSVAETTSKPIGAKLSHHNFEISKSNVVYSDVRQKRSRPQGDDA